MRLFFLQLQWLLSYQQYCNFSLNKSSKTYLGPMLPPSGRNWQQVSPHLAFLFKPSFKVHLHKFLSETLSIKNSYLYKSPLLAAATIIMDKHQLTGQNLGRDFNSRSSCMCAQNLCCYEAKQPNLKLKTRPKQLLGSLPLATALPAIVYCFLACVNQPLMMTCIFFSPTCFCGLYYKSFTIVNYDRKVCSKLWHHLLTMLELSFTILAKASILNYDHNHRLIVLAL